MLPIEQGEVGGEKRRREDEVAAQQAFSWRLSYNNGRQNLNEKMALLGQNFNLKKALEFGV